MMRSLLTFLTIVGPTLLCGLPAMAQQLEPRAYSISPTGVNIAIVAYGYSTGDLSFDPSLPIDSVSAQIHTPVLGYFRSLNVLGRSANISVAVPYAGGNLQGNYLGSFTSVYRSGLGDAVVRFGINLYGGQAMNLRQFASYRQRTNIGVSVTATAPTGQYDPAIALNIGSNRWAVKPEAGISHRFKRRFILDAYTGVWLFQDNQKFYPGNNLLSRAPIFSEQFHLSYDIKPRLWVAFDANFYAGGQGTVNGVLNNDRQSNSRVGGTISVPVTRRQSVKFAYAVGAYTTIGGKFRTFSFAYQYLWGAGL